MASEKERERSAMCRGLSKKEVSLKEAAEELGLCERQMRRVYRRWQVSGDAGLVSRRRGRKSNRVRDEVRLEFIDDATSELLYGRFVKSENTAAYLSALEGYIGERGVPQAFYTDGHSAFFAKPAADGGVSLTAFGSALEELEIEHIRSSCPESHGRCERAHGIAQDRLVKEMANEVNIEGEDEAAAMVWRVDKNRLFKYKSRQYAVELSPAVEHWTLRRCGVEIREYPTGEIRVYCNNKRLEVREVGAALTAPW